MDWRVNLRIFMQTPRRARDAWLVLIGRKCAYTAYRDGYQCGYDDGIMAERECWEELKSAEALAGGSKNEAR